MSSPLPPLTSSKPSPPISRSSPGPPSRTLSPSPPASVSAIAAVDALTMSSPPRPSTVRRSVGSGLHEAHERRAEHAEGADRDLVVVVGAEHGRAVGAAPTSTWKTSVADRSPIVSVALQRAGSRRRRSRRRRRAARGRPRRRRVGPASTASVSSPSPPSTRTRSKRRASNVCVAERHAAGRRERDRVVAGGAVDDQRPLDHPHRQRAFDELAVAVAGPRALEVAADLAARTRARARRRPCRRRAAGDRPG